MFDWDDANEEHIARHGIEPFEAENALLDLRRFVYSGGSQGERRLVAIGATEAGRLLAVVYTIRARRIRVVTAREVNAWESRRYHRGRK